MDIIKIVIEVVISREMIIEIKGHIIKPMKEDLTRDIRKVIEKEIIKKKENIVQVQVMIQEVQAIAGVQVEMIGKEEEVGVLIIDIMIGKGLTQEVIEEEKEISFNLFKRQIE